MMLTIFHQHLPLSITVIIMKFMIMYYIIACFISIIIIIIIIITRKVKMFFTKTSRGMVPPIK